MFLCFKEEKNRRRLESTVRTQGLAGSGNLTKARKTKRVQDGLKLLMAMPRKLSATKRMRMTHHEKRVGFAEPAAVVASLEKSARLPLKVAAEASKQEAAAAAAQHKDKSKEKAIYILHESRAVEAWVGVWGVSLVAYTVVFSVRDKVTPATPHTQSATSVAWLCGVTTRQPVKPSNRVRATRAVNNCRGAFTAWRV